MIRVVRKNVKDYIDWVKQLIILASAGVGGVLYKSSTPEALPDLAKWSAGLFTAAILLLCLSFVALADHKASYSDVMKLRYSLVISAGWVAFVAGFVTAVAGFV